MRTSLLLSLLLLLSCDKDGGKSNALRLAIEDSPNAKCLKKVFAKAPDFKLVPLKKADISVLLDSNLNFKNLKTGNVLQYKRQQTIFGSCGWGCTSAILGYEISSCDFAKKHASDLANLSAAEWNLDSNANGKMYISADNRLHFRRKSWISQILVIKNDSVSKLHIRGGSYTPPTNEMDTIARHLAELHEEFTTLQVLKIIILAIPYLYTLNMDCLLNIWQK